MCELCCFSHAEGSSLRGISRISGLAYDTVVSIVQAAAQKAQMVQLRYKLLIRMPLLRMSCGRLCKETFISAYLNNSLREIAGSP
jgi:hypothetical protein